jgi:thioredoxin 1
MIMTRIPLAARAGVALLLLGLAGLISGCGEASRSRETAPDDPRLLKLTKANFRSEVLEARQPVLVDFWAAWCGPCRMVAPIVSELAGEFDGRAKVGKVDVDVETALAEEYKISAIPALLIFKDGKVVDQVIGAASKAELKARLERFVGAAPAANSASRPAASSSSGAP